MKKLLILSALVATLQVIEDPSLSGVYYVTLEWPGAREATVCSQWQGHHTAGSSSGCAVVASPYREVVLSTGGVAVYQVTDEDGQRSRPMCLVTRRLR